MKKIQGFTLPELIITVTIGAILLSIASVSLFSSKGKASLTTSVTSLVSDLHLQQIKAMSGDGEGRAANDNYGVYFGQNTYTLFHGSTHTPSHPDNLVIEAGDNIEFTSIMFPQSLISYASGSGEFVNFSANSNTVVVNDLVSGQQKTITINKLGIVESVN